jgi:hypothetical protein
MLRSMKDIERSTIGATDGTSGQVKDCYFDDAWWIIRYLVVETDAGPPPNKVLLPPAAIIRLNWSEKVLLVSLTKKQIENSPDIDTDKPVSRQHVMGYRQHDDLHLRSGNAVMQYYVNASDGDIGHVDGFLVDEKAWAIRYLIVNTSNWWLGHQVLVAPQWIDEVSWRESIVCVDLKRQDIKSAPPYDAKNPLNREYESQIHAHHGRIGYWSDQTKD